MGSGTAVFVGDIGCRACHWQVTVRQGSEACFSHVTLSRSSKTGIDKVPAEKRELH